MKKTPWIAGATLAVTLAATAFAAAPDGPPKTRAEVQARVAEHFKKLDANGDGFVTKDEAAAARAKMREAFAGKRDERRAEHFALLDKDRNGALSKDEFLAPPPRGEGPEARGDRHGDRGHGRGGMRHHGGGRGFGGGALFERADADKDGKVGLAEAQAGALAMFDRVDSNKDGTISPEEHKAARDAMRAKWKDQREARGDKRG